MLPLPSGGRHWMGARMRSRLRAGGSRMHYQQFDYSTSGTDDELSNVMLPVPPLIVDVNPPEHEAPNPTDHPISPEQYLPQPFSDHEPPSSPSPQLTATEKEPSFLGTSAPLLTKPCFTDFHSNYPIWLSATQPRPDATDSDSGDPSPATSITSALPRAGTAPSLETAQTEKKELGQPKARTR